MVGERAPTWFRIVAVLLLLWGLIGCYSCVEQLRFGADAMGPSTAYDRALYAAFPRWYDPMFVVAVFSGTLGAAALSTGRRAAAPLAIVAFATVVIMFGYLFLATDIIAHKGVVVAVTFPAIVAVVAAGQWWLATIARRRGWIN